MLVVAVGFLDASSGAAIALMARRAAKFVGIVDLQEIGLGMAGERASVLVGLLAFEGHGDSGELDRFANAHVAGLAAVHDVGFRHVDLHDFGIPGFGLVLQTGELGGREVDHVLGDVGVQLFFLLVDGLDELAELGAEGGALVPQLVVGFFQLGEIVFLFAAVGVFDRGDFLFVFVKIFLFALLGGEAGFRLDVVGGGVDVGATVSEDVLDCENLGADAAPILIYFLNARGGALVCLLVGQFDGLIFGCVLDIFLRSVGLRARGIKERGVTSLPLLLEGFPRALTKVFIPQRPEQRGHEDDHRYEVVRRQRFAYDRVVIGNRLIGHQFLLTRRT